MTKSKLRQLIVKDRAFVKSLTISNLDIEIIKSVLAKDGIRTNELTEMLNISTQNASCKLKRLFEKGYLLRIESAAPSGGIEYIYKTPLYLIN